MKVESSSIHTFSRSVDFVNQLCQPLFKYTHITDFFFTRFYKDSHAIILSSTDAGLIDNIFTNHSYATMSELESFRQSSNFIFVDDTFYQYSSLRDTSRWRRYVNTFCKYQLNRRLYILKQTDNYYENYGFTCSNEIRNPLQYCIEHSDILESFITYFNHHAQTLLQDCHKNRASLDPALFLDQVSTSENEVNPPMFPDLFNCTPLTEQATPAELKCLQLIALGNTVKEAALQLNISYRTVERHILNLRQKVNAKSSKHLIRMYHDLVINDNRL